jgi:hypothetical protein
MLLRSITKHLRELLIELGESLPETPKIGE